MAVLKAVGAVDIAVHGAFTQPGSKLATVFLHAGPCEEKKAAAWLDDAGKREPQPALPRAAARRGSRTKLVEHARVRLHEPDEKARLEQAQ